MAQVTSFNAGNSSFKSNIKITADATTSKLAFVAENRPMNGGGFYADPDVTVTRKSDGATESFSLAPGTGGQTTRSLSQPFVQPGTDYEIEATYGEIGGGSVTVSTPVAEPEPDDSGGLSGDSDDSDDPGSGTDSTTDTGGLPSLADLDRREKLLAAGLIGAVALTYGGT